MGPAPICPFLLTWTSAMPGDSSKAASAMKPPEHAGARGAPRAPEAPRTLEEESTVIARVAGSRHTRLPGRNASALPTFGAVALRTRRAGTGPVRRSGDG